MRFVDRSTVVQPACLDLSDDESAASKELAKARKHFEDNPDKPFKSFNTYGRPEVRQALELLFEGKCAYCESRFSATQPVDVEHWRPKGSVEQDAGEDKHPGYWWLAAKWENLLPSCIDCNRRRYQQLAVSGETVKRGKGDHFPVRAARITGPEDAETTEQPLLLNPCVDRPEDLLLFVEEAVVRDVDGLAEQDKDRVRMSIDVYGLNRTNLVFARKEVRLIMEEHMHVVRQIAKALNDDDVAARPSIVAILEDLLRHEMAVLTRFAERGRPYSAMARQLLDAFREELTTP